MWPFSRALIASMTAASVVDLPEPVLPVTRIKPRVAVESSNIDFGILSSSSVSAFEGMPRNTAPTPFKCRNTLTRKRATSGMKCAKSAESCLLNCAIDCSDMISNSSALSSSGSRRWLSSVMRSPWTRMRGGSPATTCRSEPLRMYMLFRKSLINDVAIGGSFSIRVRARARALRRCLAGSRCSCGLRGGLGGGRGRCRASAARQHCRVGHEALELLAIRRVAIGVIGVDELCSEGGQESLVHHLHALLFAGLQLRGDLMRLLRLNQFRDRAIHDHDLDDGAAAAAVRRLDEVLRHDGVQAVREEALRLLALLAGQRVDDAVDRLHGARRVQRAEHEVARFRRRHRHADRLAVAELADEDDVGVLAQARAHSLCEARNVGAQLALDDLAAFAAVDELDRVFEADDV